MKNDLTAEEWLVLNENITYGYIAFEMWNNQGCLKEKLKILDAAKEKFYKVADGIKRG